MSLPSLRPADRPDAQYSRRQQGKGSRDRYDRGAINGEAIRSGPKSPIEQDPIGADVAYQQRFARFIEPIVKQQIATSIEDPKFVEGHAVPIVDRIVSKDTNVQVALNGLEIGNTAIGPKAGIEDSVEENGDTLATIIDPGKAILIPDKRVTVPLVYATAKYRSKRERFKEPTRGGFGTKSAAAAKAATSASIIRVESEAEILVVY